MALPDTIKPLFASASTITVTNLSTLTNTSTATSDAIDNTSTLYDEILLELNITGTGAATAWIDVRVVVSIDGGTNYSTWNSGLVLPAIDFSASPQIYTVRFPAPQRFKIMVKNNTGASFTGGVCKIQGINYQVVD